MHLEPIDPKQYENTLNWLLEPENPSVRYLTLRDILKYPLDSTQIMEAKASLEIWGKVQRIFKKQKQEGYWESKDDPYNPKYKASYWQIMILGMLGFDKRDERVKRACDYIFRFQHPDGGFTSIMEEGARKKYDMMEKRFLRRGKEPPPFDAWVDEFIRENDQLFLFDLLFT